MYLTFFYFNNFIPVCIHCEVEWDDWGECFGGKVSRTQYVKTAPQGDGADQCPELATDTEGN